MIDFATGQLSLEVGILENCSAGSFTLGYAFCGNLFSATFAQKLL